MAPEFSTISHLVQLSDPHAVGVRGSMLCFYIHGDFTEIKIWTYSRSCRDPGFLQNGPYHLHGKLMGSLFVKDKVLGNIHHYFVNRIDMYVLRSDIAKIDLVNSRAVVDIMRHTGNCSDVVSFQGRVRLKLRRGEGGSGKQAVGGIPITPIGFLFGNQNPPASLSVYFLHPLFNFKEPRPAGNPISFHGGRDSQTNGLLRAGNIRYDKICRQGVKLSVHALHRGVKGLQVDRYIGVLLLCHLNLSTSVPRSFFVSLAAARSLICAMQHFIPHICFQSVHPWI